MVGIVFFLMAIFALAVSPATARTFQFQLTDNYLNFSNQHSTVEAEEVEVEEVDETVKADPVLEAESELAENQVRVKEQQPWTLDLKEGIAELSFEFFIDSVETLTAFDEPAFYVSLEKGSERKIIYTHCLSGEKNWQKVALKLGGYDLKQAKVVFWAGNLGDDQLKTQVWLRSIEEHFSTSLTSCQAVSDFLAHLEADGSVTLEINAESKASNRNYTWWGKCGAAEPRQLIVTNYYLLSDYEIVDFWPNFGDKMLFNLTDFPCVDLTSLRLERCR